MRLPLFPLHSVLFPGGLLPLRIFETRYLDMVRDCLRNDTGFAVCAIESGQEVGPAPNIHRLGTLARIADWNQRDDGLLGIVARGEQRLRILDYAVAGNGLLVGEVELLDAEEPVRPLPGDYGRLRDLLQRMLEQLGGPYGALVTAYDDAGWVGARLSELLPLPSARKQQLFEMDDPLRRLDELLAFLGGT